MPIEVGTIRYESRLDDDTLWESDNLDDTIEATRPYLDDGAVVIEWECKRVITS